MLEYSFRNEDLVRRVAECLCAVLEKESSHQGHRVVGAQANLCLLRAFPACDRAHLQEDGDLAEAQLAVGHLRPVVLHVQEAVRVFAAILLVDDGLLWWDQPLASRVPELWVGVHLRRSRLRRLRLLGRGLRHGLRRGLRRALCGLSRSCLLCRSGGLLGLCGHRSHAWFTAPQGGGDPSYGRRLSERRRIWVSRARAHGARAITRRAVLATECRFLGVCRALAEELVLSGPSGPSAHLHIFIIQAFAIT